MDEKPTSKPAPEKITPETAMAGQCFFGAAPEDYHGGYTSVEPFEVQKRYLSNKPLFRQKIKLKKQTRIDERGDSR